MVTSADKNAFTETITVAFTGVSLFESDWIIHDMNLMINQSNLDKMNFTVGQEDKSEKNNLNMKVSIYNSSFQHVHTANSSEYNISIIECFIDGNERWKETLLSVRNSNVHIKDSFFKGHNADNGTSVIDALKSYVFIENTTFVHNTGKQGVIRVSDDSKLSLQTSMFYQNGKWHFFCTKSTVIARRKSLVTVFKCNFSSNWASTGGCMYCDTNSSLIMHDSIMQFNKAQHGGAIYFQGEDDKIREQNEKLMKTTAASLMDTLVPDGIILNNHFKQCFIQTSHFQHNFAFGYGGGALYIQKASVEIKNSHFSLNDAFVAGCSIMAAQSDLNIMNTTFFLDLTVFVISEGSLIYATDHSLLNVYDSYVSGEAAIKSGSISIKKKVILRIRKLTFDSPIQQFFTQFSMHVSDHSTVVITHSNFRTQYPSPGIFRIEDYSTLVVLETTFTNDGKPGSSVLSANNNIKIKFKNCTFVKCAGFTASGRSLLTIENCLITNSEYVLDQALILASDESFINIHRSNLLDNKPDVDIPFLRLSKSNATMNECWYTGNVMCQHFMLTEDSLLSISDTNFSNNSLRIRAMFASIFYLAESKILIQDSIFKNNYYYTFIIHVTFVAIFDAYSSDITLNSCQIVHDIQLLPPDYTIHMRSPVFTRIPSNFLQIK